MWQADLEALLSIPPGTPLAREQALILADFVAKLVAGAGTRRKHVALVHDSLQDTIGLFLQRLPGVEVAYAVPFRADPFETRSSVFDIVAWAGKELSVVEVKDVVTSRDLGQVHGYINALQVAKVKGQVYLGTDVLNYGNVVSGALGKSVNELMMKEGMGVMLADQQFLMICGNHLQLGLKEMPRFLFSEEKVA